RYVTNTADFYYNFSDQSIGYFYGAGLIFKVSESLGIDLEYNTQSLDSKVPAGPFILGGDRILSDLQVIKLGISYNF
ncbi:MAG: opacity protein-like surface antigen, partial [Lentimonas sp.]